MQWWACLRDRRYLSRDCNFRIAKWRSVCVMYWCFRKWVEIVAKMKTAIPVHFLYFSTMLIAIIFQTVRPATFWWWHGVVAYWASCRWWQMCWVACRSAEGGSDFQWAACSVHMRGILLVHGMGTRALEECLLLVWWLLFPCWLGGSYSLGVRSYIAHSSACKKGRHLES